MMASFSLLSPTLPTTNTKKTNTFFSKTPSHNRFKVSCNADNNKSSETSLNIQQNNVVDRRNLLLGLGGLYGAANLTTIQSASAGTVAIESPDNIALCGEAKDNVNLVGAIRGTACCPPLVTPYVAPIRYQLPVNPVARVRPSAQTASNDPVYVQKYQDAIAKMKALPDDDPRSWKNQGKIHCAYCNGGFTHEKTGFELKMLQIHDSWLFFPFHRWYLYFYERILGSLIDDPTFALPYWNWDNPDGMSPPAMFEFPYGTPANIRNNPLFDAFRDVTHLAPTIIDLQGGFVGTDEELINNNLAMVNTQMFGDPTLFFGGKSTADEIITLGGPIEAGVHTRVHVWTGNPRLPNREDMGNFYSAGYDPIFYCHHANVDRMWSIWKTLGPANVDPTENEWLNSSFVFYDENQTLVRVYSGDSVDTTMMGYSYADSPTPWIGSTSTPHAAESHIATLSIGTVPKAEDTVFPVKLDQIVKLLVKRPAINRTKAEKDVARERLVLNGINFDGTTYFKFNVLVNDVDDGIPISASDSEFVGTFEQLQHGLNDEPMEMTSAAVFGITGILEDLKAEDDEYVLVSLLPIEGCDDVTISEIKIELLNIA